MTIEHIPNLKKVFKEINRILTDRITDLLLCSEPSGIDNLNAENTAHDKIELVGNTMIDTLMYH